MTEARIHALTLPKWGLSMTEGTIVTLHKAEGDAVAAGDILADIESSKIANELEARDAGVLRRWLVAEGDTCEVGALIGVISDPAVGDDEVERFVRGFAPDAGGDALPVAEAPAAAAPAAPQAAPAAAAPPPGQGVLATDQARKLAENLGIDLATVQGSGRAGRISKEDVLAAHEARGGGAPAPAAAPAGDDQGWVTVPLSSMRRTIARRLAQAKATAPHFRLVADLVMDPLVELRAGIAPRDGLRPTLNDLLVRAAADALVAVPAVNVQFDGSELRQYQDAHIGVAVALEEGLIVPVVRSANRKGIHAIAAETAALRERARSGGLAAEDVEGATFTISNLGAAGPRQFDAIIDPPQCSILAVGALRQAQLFDASGNARVARVCTVTLSCDHRIIDGALGARFLQALKSSVEDPAALPL